MTSSRRLSPPVHSPVFPPDASGLLALKASQVLECHVVFCAGQPEWLQTICDRLSAARIEAFMGKWLASLAHPFTAADRAAGCIAKLAKLEREALLAIGQPVRRSSMTSTPA